MAKEGNKGNNRGRDGVSGKGNSDGGPQASTGSDQREPQGGAIQGGQVSRATQADPSTRVSRAAYQEAGVNVAAGDQLVDWLQAPAPPPHYGSRLVEGIGGFASIFRMDFPNMKRPCMVTCTDGVGTKVKLASRYPWALESLGQDLVAMCVNDLLCVGAQPLIFLDYYASGKLDLKLAQSFLKGVRKSCHEALCDLVGGETAEMPGIYQGQDFDCAGFAVGVVDEEERWGPSKVREGDLVLGISSSGFHSNGYSLLRKLFEKDEKDWAELLLKPTYLYSQLVNSLVIRGGMRSEIHAAAHITGGGMENVGRILPPHLSWERKDWEWPPLFKEAQGRAQISDQEMLATFNCGVGFVFLVSSQGEGEGVIKEVGTSLGFQVYDLGRVIRSGGA